jgi:hypothetical protein
MHNTADQLAAQTKLPEIMPSDKSKLIDAQDGTFALLCASS